MFGLGSLIRNSFVLSIERKVHLGSHLGRLELCRLSPSRSTSIAARKATTDLYYIHYINHNKDNERVLRGGGGAASTGAGEWGAGRGG